MGGGTSKVLHHYIGKGGGNRNVLLWKEMVFDVFILHSSECNRLHFRVVKFSKFSNECIPPDPRAMKVFKWVLLHLCTLLGLLWGPCFDRCFLSFVVQNAPDSINLGVSKFSKFSAEVHAHG